MKTTKRYIRVPRTIVRSDAHLDPTQRAIGTCLQISDGVRSVGAAIERVAILAVFLLILAGLIRVASYYGAA
jgi:hypothetical protein